MILTIISIVLFAAYIIGASVKMGRFPESIAETSAAFEWPWRVLWFVAVWGATALAAPALIEHSSKMTMWLAFLSIASATVFAMVARLNEDVDKLINTIAGWAFIVASQALVIANHWWLVFLWVPVIVLAILRRLPCWKFFVALTAIVTSYIHCFI